MAIKVNGVWRDAKAWHIKVAGTWRSAKSVWIKVAGVWKEQGLADETLIVSINKTSLTASGDNSSVYTNYCECLPLGGSLSYGYTWQRISGSSNVKLGSASNLKSVRFYNSTIGTYAAVYRCTVIDTNGATNSATISVSITREFIDGGGVMD